MRAFSRAIIAVLTQFAGVDVVVPGGGGVVGGVEVVVVDVAFVEVVDEAVTVVEEEFDVVELALVDVAVCARAEAAPVAMSEQAIAAAMYLEEIFFIIFIGLSLTTFEIYGLIYNTRRLNYLKVTTMLCLSERQFRL